MTYQIAFRDEYGRYRCDETRPDLASAIRITLAKARETLNRHYILDRKGRLVDIVNPR
jgi:hypothetical protein